jgi:hypothetical protein
VNPQIGERLRDIHTTHLDYTDMKDNIRRLQWCLKLFGYKNFYSVGATEYGVTMQGVFSADVAKKAKSLRFSQEINDNGYIILKRGNIEIILT